ncbi:MAG: rod shape-determining protein MreC [Atopobium sp.]|uniref:rod shape-determining protein MreC n=1 Tax=Atopobium sp. TaxID=1872650 RepID=UPI002A75E731|nr:rod shape-determining protein MreC [Atopobium sp.]MDY2788640.1 rod shape-determining protein MreC [Atopobium sp.]MDY4522148.1 rod shape-determining protein MreC [Atopobium sp.]
MALLSPHSARTTGMPRKGATGGRLATILCIIALIVFTLSCREAGHGPITMTRDMFSVITTPVRSVGSFISMPFKGIGNIFSNLTASQETLSELKAENDKLRTKNVELSEAQQTADRLQGLLDLKSAYKLQSTAAHVVSGSTDSWSSTITIDKGSAAGMQIGMPVMDSTGVIGQISEVGPTSSVVRLISDETSSVSAMVQSSRAQGMLVGSADGTLRLTLVTTDQSVAIGDTIVTSGLGGIYPKGLPLGTVSALEKNAGAMYYVITVKPFRTSSSFEEVLVITSLTDEQQATAQEAAQADKQESSSTSATSTSASSASAATDAASDSSRTKQRR